MRLRALRSLLFAVSISWPLFCHAEENCLWLNAATAGGILGGPVTMSVSKVSADSSNMRAANAISSAGPTSADPSGSKYYGNGIDDSGCTFVLQSGTSRGTLHIEVRTMKEPRKEFASFLARCGSHAIALKSVGNEAVTCNIDSTSGDVVEQVVGRVRDRAFVIRLSRKDSPIAEDLLREKIRRVADLVAGNLF